MKNRSRTRSSCFRPARRAAPFVAKRLFLETLEDRRLLAADITTGLAAHWQLEETVIGQTVVDASGLGNEASHVNIVAPDGPNTNAAVGTYSLGVDGVDDYVSVPGDPSLDLSGGQFTQSIWIYPENTDNGFHGVLGYQPSRAQRYPGIWVKAQDRIHAGFGDGTSWNGFSTGSVLTPSDWNHVVTTFDGTAYKVYVDGVEVASITDFAGLTPFPTQQVDIGRVDNYFDGLIDEVRIYNRALTQEDVTALFAAGADTDVPTANLVNVVHGANINFTVSYVDNLAIDVGTLDSSDIRVTGPGGFDQFAALLSVDDNTNGTPRTAVYDITAPTVNGTYTVSLEAGQVSDTSGNFVAAGVLGTFEIDDTSVEPDPTGLVGHWKLEETALGQAVADASGLGNNGAHTNITTPDGPDANAAVGTYSLSTDGVDDYVSVPADPSLDLSGGHFTQSVWIYPDTIAAGFYGVLGYQEGPAFERYPGLWVKGPDRLHTGFGDGTSWNGFSTGSVLTPSDWNHVVTTFDGTTYKVYVDGVDVASNTDFAGLTPFPTQQVDIGRVDNYFDGLIDDVRIYKRVLDTTEVGLLFALGTDTDAPTANLVNVVHGANTNFTVSYVDNLAIDVGTLDSSDIRVTGPGGFDQLAALVSVDDNTNGTPRTAVYGITAPTVNGTYTVSLEAGQVSDTSGNFVAAGVLGTFEIDDTSVEPDPTGLVGHWKLEETALGQTVVDASGLGNDGTHTNITAPDGPDTNAAVGTYSLSTDGVDDYVSVPADPSLDLSGGQFTQSVWIYPDTIAAGFHGVLGYQEGPASERYPGIWVKAPDRIHVGFGDGTSWMGFSTGNVLTPSDWNHVVTTFDGTAYKVYVDGVEVASNTDFAGLTPFPTQQVDIGRVDNYFDGLIDDARIYTRVLDASEAGLLFNLGASNPGTIALPGNSFSVNEPDGVVSIPVIRTEGTNGTVSVDYTTVDDTATSPLDFTATSGTVTFLDGETLQTIDIPIIDDNAGEGNETFSISLDAVGGGANLGTPRTGIITIVDDDPPASTGNGLRGEYYDNIDLTNLQLIRTDTVVDFDWGGGSPDASVGSDTFSVRWTGQVEPLFTETYAFHATTDDGVRVWIDGQLIIDNWVDQSATTATGTIDLIGRYRYDVVMEYYENGGSALAKLEWSSASQTLQTIPQNQLYDGSLTGPTLTIGASLISFDEGAGTAQVNVLRLGDTSGTASVTYATSDGTATAASDYTATSGTLNFAVDDTSRTISIPILDDSELEVNETISVTLSNPVGAILGTQSFTTVKIIDDDPGNFTQETFISGLIQPTMFEWAPDGRMFVAHKSGIVQVYDNAVLQSTFIDISAQVNDVRDRGLLGFALHPDFPNTPYAYLLFTYDPPETQGMSGLAGPDEFGNRVSRLIRVTADSATNYATALPGSEVVLLGTNSTWANISEPGMDSTGDPSIAPSCPPDGTLQDCIPIDSQSHTIGLVKFGLDGNLFVSSGDGTSYGMVDPRTVRVQDLNSLSGKLLRIDPITGEALNDNPFFDGDVNSNKSKVYSYGLRNPFRFAIHPVTGEPYVGDVGWTKWEEINTGRGANFGWPYYEGGSGVSLQTGGYKDLPEALAFYASGQPVTAAIHARNHADGARAIIMGDFYTETAFPSVYHGALFFADVNEGTVDFMTFDAEGDPEPVRRFASGFGGIVHMATGPDGNLYFTNIGGYIGRFVPGGTGAPSGPGGGGSGGASAGNTFFIVDAQDDVTYHYESLVSQPDTFGLSGRNTKPEGIAANADGSRVWVVDGRREVFAYDASGNQLGNWRPNGVRTPTGIATDGSDVWIVDQRNDKVSYFAGGAALTAGRIAATSSFELDVANGNPTGLTTDGQFLWVVDMVADQVFKYTASGLLVGQWSLDVANQSAQGITIDPTGFSNRLWVVDSSSLQVFEYAEGANYVTGAQSANVVHDLDPANAHPRGITDPPRRPSSSVELMGMPLAAVTAGAVPIRVAEWQQALFGTFPATRLRPADTVEGELLLADVIRHQREWPLAPAAVLDGNDSKQRARLTDRVYMDLVDEPIMWPEIDAALDQISYEGILELLIPLPRPLRASVTNGERSTR